MKDKEDRNGARRYMAEELYVENTGYPYLTSCSVFLCHGKLLRNVPMTQKKPSGQGSFLYSIHRFSEWGEKAK